MKAGTIGGATCKGFRLGRHARESRWVLIFLSLATLAGCDAFTDAATRLAYDIESGAGRLGRESGAKYRIEHVTPSKAGECVGPYTVQLDKVGALVIWCKDATGRTVSSHSTTYHARFVDTPHTYILDKPAGAILTIYIERRGRRPVIIDVR
ncbi:MAG: hypothetical protein WCE38_12655 [Burkholderiales bacterium]